MSGNNRIIKESSVGNVQAWDAHPYDTSVNVTIYAGVRHCKSRAAYMSQSLNLTAADARDLARVLIEAADHADAVKIDSAPDKAR